MLSFALASMLVAAVLAEEKDPTKVCFPDVFQIEVFSLQHRHFGIQAYDFTKGISASNYTSGNRQVTLKSQKFVAVVNETSGACMKMSMPDDVWKFDSKCLPAHAILLKSAPTTLGQLPVGLDINIWEYTLPVPLTVTIGVTKSNPAIPVFRQYKTSIPELEDTEILYNAKTKIEDPRIFSIPPVCPSFNPGG